MYRDYGRRTNIGYGLPLQQQSSGETEGGGNQNRIQKALNGHPVMRFFSVAAASIIAMGVAGKVVREGGLRLAERAQTIAQGSGHTADFFRENIRSFRKIESQLDALEGINRELIDPENPDILVKRVNGKLVRDHTNDIDNFHIRSSKLDRDPSLTMWSTREELQQRMIRQARRLPYEVPGFYAAQKAIIEPLSGTDNPKDKVNWKNPVDVIGDFAYQSMKNILVNVLPFEAAGGAARNTYRTQAARMAQNPTGHMGFLSTRVLLNQIGIDATDLMDKAVKVSHQSIGAFSSMISEASNEGKGFTDWARTRKNVALTNTPEYSNANFARKLWLHARDVATNKDEGLKAIDMLPGPFRGMGSGVQRFGQKFKEIGQTHDDWQSIMSGRTRLEELRRKSIQAADGSPDKQRYLNLRSYMAKGGGTTLEQYGKSVFELGKGGPRLPNGTVNPDWRTGTFYQQRSNDTYRGLLAEQLSRTTGISPEDAMKFTTLSNRISSYPGVRAPYPGGENLIERMQFTFNKYHGSSTTEWWESVTRGAAKHGINMQGDAQGLRLFQNAVRTADYKYTGSNFRAFMDNGIREQWDTAYNQVIPKYASQAMQNMKKPYELFQGTGLAQNRDFLVNKSAQRLGIDIVDNAGNPLAANRIKQGLWNRGFNPDDLHALRGYLVSQKDIAPSWSQMGKNLFGFRPMSVEEGFRNSYFAGSERDTQRELRNLVDRRTYGPTVGRGGNMDPTMAAHAWDLKINKAFVGPNGKVIDFNRMSRSFITGLDKINSEFQIPLLGIKPMELFGWKSFQSWRNQPSIIMASGESIQPIAMAGGKAFEKPDFYLYMKSSAKKTKGHVVGIGSGGVTEYEGLFRPNMTNTQNMLGRYGNTMMRLNETPSSSRADQKWKRLFDVNSSQENNLFFGRQSVGARWWQSLTRKPTAMANPVRAAERFAAPGFRAGAMTASESEGVDQLIGTLRNYGFSARTLREMQQDPTFAHIFNMVDPLGNNVLNVPDNLLPRVIKDALAKDRAAVRGTASASGAIRMQQNLTNLLKQGDQQVNFWDLAAPSNARATGISRRIDQLKSELYDYLTIRQGAAAPNGSVTDFNATIGNMINKLDDLASKGMISATEKAEGRAAILSLQMENARNQTYNPGSTYSFLSHNQETMDMVLNQGVQSRQLLAETGRMAPLQDGYKGFLKRQMSMVTQQTPYEKPFQINATGGNTVFMPTFGTAFARNPRAALMGAAGMSRAPEALSGGSLPMEHMVNRLNSYFETFNIGLDPAKYKSPLDQFARGIIGKRVLPIYAAGATALAIDRTAGGIVHDKDAEGNRVYSPLVLGALGTGVAAGQVAMAGLIPGGQTGSEKREELLHGEVPIRSGRFWMMGNTPFKGGRIQYFRPSWYQRLKSGGGYTPEMHQTPLENLAFSQDFSPLKLLDPYRREREDYATRPYPLSGDYFTGPWGPMNSVLNATVGKVIKPTRRMHEQETAYGLSQYAPVGEDAAYFSQTPLGVSGGQGSAAAAVRQNTTAIASMYSANSGSTSRAAGEVRQRATDIATMYSNNASAPGRYVSNNEALVPYGVPVMPGLMQPRVVASGAPETYGSVAMNARRLGFQTQEITGIYGFTAGALRSGMGFGNQDLAPRNAVLEPASRGYSASRSFWGLNMGGLGDLPLPVEGRFGNLEISEIVRRFVPKDPAGTQYVNNIPNQMGKQYPWLPGADYPLANLKAGDPYGQMPDAEIRLPGTGYARTHQMYGDQYGGGKLGLANIHDILGDVAPWSAQFDAIDKAVNGLDLDPMSRAKIEQTRAQVEAMRYENEFTPYRHKYDSLAQTVNAPTSSGTGRFMEWVAHRDTYLNTKLGAPRTAVEDWERDNVYGSTFPQWQRPVESFLKPAVAKSTQRDPISATLAGGSLGYLFGVSTEAKGIGTVVGGTIGLAASIYGTMYEKLTGDRYLPKSRRKELALEENIDILSYTRSQYLASQSSQAGDEMGASFFASQARSTMYGANLNGTPEQLAMAVPKRKREHFRAMLFAPEQEHQQILSTAGRLERRLYEAAWGMQVEERPDLGDYYQDHELPPPDSDVWSPQLDMDNVKIKMGQHMGLDMSQMGYYPQQISEANLINPPYPDFGTANGGGGFFNGFSIRSQLKRMMLDKNIRGSVTATPSAFAGNRYQLEAGVYN